MSSAARLLLARGCEVSGSDNTPTEITAELAALGAKVSIGHDPANLPGRCDLVVATAAAKADNPELVEARKRGLHIIKYARLVGLLMRDRLGVGVAGTHGKTTTSSMLTEVLRASAELTCPAGAMPAFPSYIIGGKIVGHAGADCSGSGELFVAEACEYDRSFHELHPAYAIITNLEPDHLDYYGNVSSLVEAFQKFAEHLPGYGALVVNADSQRAVEVVKCARCRVETYGAGADCDWRVLTVELGEEGYVFVIRHGESEFRFELRVPGYHNVLNATAAAAMAFNLGVGGEAVAQGLARFGGVQRRFQVLTGNLPITVIDDYAHHPTEIAAVLRAVRERFPGRRIWAIFQAHQHARTRAFFEEFARSLMHADRVTIAKIYSVRETRMDLMSVSGADISGRLYQLSIDSEYVREFGEITNLLERESREGDVVVVMGAGDIYKVAHSFARGLIEGLASELSRTETSV